LLGIKSIDVRRTSSQSLKDFEAMLERGAAGRPEDADVATLAGRRHTIVLAEGEELRRRLGPEWCPRQWCPRQDSNLRHLFGNTPFVPREMAAHLQGCISASCVPVSGTRRVGS
jgi:hypothetical protein